MLIKDSHKSSNEFFILLFIKLIGFIFLFAFIDSCFQYKTLIGENGCAPIASFLQETKKQFGSAAIWKFPSLFWLSSSDNFILTVFLIGILASISVIASRFTGLSLFLSLLCWLSVINTGSDFFLYIWDTLLIEAGFIAFLVSYIYKNEKYIRLVNITLWLLAFRLWFSMGIVTVLHNNTVPLNGQFIAYFFQNQPMPSKLAFFAYHFHPFAHTLIGLFLLMVEVIVPFAILHAKTRGIAFYIFVFFSILIFLVGNYAWFNLLSIILAIPLLIQTKQGEYIYHKTKRLKLTGLRLAFNSASRVIIPIIYTQIILQSLLLIFICFPLGNRYLNFLNYYSDSPNFLAWENKNYFTKILSVPIHLGTNLKIANPYGVFKGIPVKRWEIAFEVCNDTVKGPFKKVPYQYKPGFNSGSSFFAPHHPRLEQQLFYEAQQGNFSANYTPYQNKLNTVCWTQNYLKRLFDSDKAENGSYTYVKINVIELRYNTTSDYAITGLLWQKRNVFSYYVNEKSVNCALIKSDNFLKYNKHSEK